MLTILFFVTTILFFKSDISFASVKIKSLKKMLCVIYVIKHLQSFKTDAINMYHKFLAFIENHIKKFHL